MFDVVVVVPVDVHLLSLYDNKSSQITRHAIYQRLFLFGMTVTFTRTHYSCTSTLYIFESSLFFPPF